MGRRVAEAEMLIKEGGGGTGLERAGWDLAFPVFAVFWFPGRLDSPLTDKKYLPRF